MPNDKDKYTEEKRAELIEEILAAFSWRKKPDKIWRTNVWDGKDLEKNVDPVDSRDFTFELMERHVQLHRYCDFIHFFTNQGFQYYLPSLMSLLLVDLNRSDGLVDVLIHSLHRIPPFIYPIDQWEGEVEKLAPEEELQHLRSYQDPLLTIESLRRWFVERAHPEQIGYTCNLTQEEKRVVLLFLDYIETTPEFKPFEMVAVRSFYDGGSLSKRLGVVSFGDFASLIKVLQLLRSKYPSRFHSHEVKAVIEQLLLEKSLL